MAEDFTVIAGIKIPSRNPFFLETVAFHILVGLTAVAAGVMAIFSKKRRGLHSTSGAVYFWSLTAIFISSSVLAVMRWSEDYHLFILGSLSFAAALLGRTALRQRWRGWVRWHIGGMGSSFVLMLIAFYVDNGKQLPVWKNLPPVLYWLLPALIGLPIIVYEMLRHPLAGGRERNAP